MDIDIVFGAVLIIEHATLFDVNCDVCSKNVDTSSIVNSGIDTRSNKNGFHKSGCRSWYEVVTML